MTIKGAAEGHLAASIVYLCALLADRPRFIDRYIDYYGETPGCTRDGAVGVLRQSAQRVATAEQGGAR